VYWIDVFIRPIYKELVVENLKYCQKEKGPEIYAWCIMSSHIHLIIGTQGKEKIQDILQLLTIQKTIYIHQPETMQELKD